MLHKRNVLLKIFSGSFLLFTCVFFIFSMYQKDTMAKRYDCATEYLRNKEYDNAISILALLTNYKDSDQLLQDAIQGKEYSEAVGLFNNNKFKEAMDKFEEIDGFEDSRDWQLKAKYYYALELFDSGDYNNAKRLFQELVDYKDSKQYSAKCDLHLIEDSRKIVYEEACLNFLNENYEDALIDFVSLEDYEDSERYAEECRKILRRQNKLKEISAGIQYTLAITDKGNVKTTGFNNECQSEVDQWTDIISISGFDVITIGLKKDKTVVTTGYVDGYSIDTSNWEDIIDVSAGPRHIVGLTGKGRVVGQGQNTDGQLDVGGWRGIVDVATGWKNTVGLTRDGQVYVAGHDSQELEEEIRLNEDKWRDVIAIAANGGGSNRKCRGKGHIVGLKKDGTVVAVGDNTYKQLEVESWEDIIEIAAGDWYTVGLKSDGTVLITGENSPGNQYIDEEIYGWKDIQSIAAGFGQTVGITKDGQVVAIGFNEEDKRDGVANWENIRVKESY